MSSNTSYERYGRQILLKEFGEAGQQKLLQAKVLMIGAGGLGCAALPYLTGSGVGTIGIIDDDTVALHNLHRQVLYSIHDIGLPKVNRAASALRQLNPDVLVETFNERLTVSNAIELLDKYDIIIDGTDNFSARYMINDACVLLNKPFVYGAVSRFEGQVAVFNCLMNGNETSANYRDLFPHPPAPGEVANCAEAGVLGMLPGIIGTMQAAETIKLIAGIGIPLIDRLLTYNALSNQVYELQLSAQKETRSLIPANTIAFKEMNYDQLCGVYENGVEIDSTTFNELKDKKNVLIVDVREYHEMPAVNEFEHISIPLGSIAEKLPASKMDTIIVFCQSGKRSLQAAKLLMDTFGNTKKVYSLGGGILQWKHQQQLSK